MLKEALKEIFAQYEKAPQQFMQDCAVMASFAQQGFPEPTRCSGTNPRREQEQ